jgi:hypothetical protein
MCIKKSDDLTVNVLAIRAASIRDADALRIVALRPGSTLKAEVRYWHPKCKITSCASALYYSTLVIINVSKQISKKQIS